MKRPDARARQRVRPPNLSLSGIYTIRPTGGTEVPFLHFPLGDPLPNRDSIRRGDHD
jgi:hypothetical protein